MISGLEICGRKEGWGVKFEILSCGSLQAWMISGLEICGRKKAGVKI
jgi:hypothetical protein